MAMLANQVSQEPRECNEKAVSKTDENAQMMYCGYAGFERQFGENRKNCASRGDRTCMSKYAASRSAFDSCPGGAKTS